jgi:hypothetical protein
MSRLRGWLEQLRALNAALLEVLGAEIEALFDDLRTSGRHLAGGVVWLALAASLAFFLLAALVAAAVAALALVLPLWGAILVVALVLALAAGAALAAGVRRLRRVESPAATVRRRVADHVYWWQRRVAGDEREAPAAHPPGEDQP